MSVNLNRRERGKHRSRWEDNIKLDIKEIGSENDDCIHLAQDKVHCGLLRTFSFHKRCTFFFISRAAVRISRTQFDEYRYLDFMLMSTAMPFRFTFACCCDLPL